MELVTSVLCEPNVKGVHSIHRVSSPMGPQTKAPLPDRLRCATGFILDEAAYYLTINVCDVIADGTGYRLLQWKHEGIEDTSKVTER